jgi:hypothetical protein
MSIESKVLKQCLIVVLLGLSQAAFGAEPIAKIVGGTLAPNHVIGQQLSGQKVKRLFYMFQNSLATLSH